MWPVQPQPPCMSYHLSRGRTQFHLWGTCEACDHLAWHNNHDGRTTTPLQEHAGHFFEQLKPGKCKCNSTLISPTWIIFCGCHFFLGGKWTNKPLHSQKKTV